MRASRRSSPQSREPSRAGAPTWPKAPKSALSGRIFAQQTETPCYVYIANNDLLFFLQSLNLCLSQRPHALQCTDNEGTSI